LAAAEKAKGRGDVVIIGPTPVDLVIIGATHLRLLEMGCATPVNIPA